MKWIKFMVPLQNPAQCYTPRSAPPSVSSASFFFPLVTSSPLRIHVSKRSCWDLAADVEKAPYHASWGLWTSWVTFRSPESLP